MVRVALIVCLALSASACRRTVTTLELKDLELALDREHTDPASGGAITPATLSINRYHSILRRLNRADLRLDANGRVSLLVHAKSSTVPTVRFENIDVRYLVPVLPYAHGRTLDDFDKVNLFLAEYARNGIELSQAAQNTRFGAFAADPSLFNDEEEYQLEENGKLVPNPAARPKRMSLTNNCLAPGLWELSASDSAGETHHAWFKLPPQAIFSLLRAANDVDATDEELGAALTYRGDLGRVRLDLDRLRTKGELIHKGAVSVNTNKDVLSYSTQDSRRKVQRKFFVLERGGAKLEAQKLGELQPGDLFKMHSFVEPGVYSLTPRVVPYEPIWSSAEISLVTPKTKYGDEVRREAPLGYIELVLRTQDQKRAIVLGNVPVDLLVFEDDFAIPAFGAGVLPPSEPIERRYLYFEQGPAPHYAYLAKVEGEDLVVENNHEGGLEQIFLRPFQREGRTFLRLTLVSYERIVDLLEVEMPLEGELEKRVLRASQMYQPPLYRVYTDSNTR
jgi:hypothetical protein